MRLWIITIWLVFSIPAWADEELTLETAVAEGLAQNTDIPAAGFQAQARR